METRRHKKEERRTGTKKRQTERTKIANRRSVLCEIMTCLEIGGDNRQWKRGET